MEKFPRQIKFYQEIGQYHLELFMEIKMEEQLVLKLQISKLTNFVI